MPRMLPAPLAEFIEFQPVLERLLIFRGVIIYLFAHGAFELDKIVLGHTLNEL